MTDNEIPTTTGLPADSLLSSAVYDKLKPLVMIILPAISTAYFTLSNIWGWQHEEQIIGTLAVITTILGAILGVASKSYNNSDKKFTGGAIETTTKEDGTTVYTLSLDIDPDDIKKYSDLVFKVLPRAA